MNTMVGLQASLHTSVGHDISELMKNNDEPLVGAELDLDAADMFDDDEFDPEELLKSPLFNDSTGRINADTTQSHNHGQSYGAPGEAVNQVPPPFVSPDHSEEFEPNPYYGVASYSNSPAKMISQQTQGPSSPNQSNSLGAAYGSPVKTPVTSVSYIPALNQRSTTMKPTPYHQQPVNNPMISYGMHRAGSHYDSDSDSMNSSFHDSGNTHHGGGGGRVHYNMDDSVNSQYSQHSHHSQQMQQQLQQEFSSMHRHGVDRSQSFSMDQSPSMQHQRVMMEQQRNSPNSGYSSHQGRLAPGRSVSMHSPSMQPNHLSQMQQMEQMRRSANSSSLGLSQSMHGGSMPSGPGMGPSMQSMFGRAMHADPLGTGSYHGTPSAPPFVNLQNGGHNISIASDMHSQKSVFDMQGNNGMSPAIAAASPLNEAMEKLCDSMKRSAMSRSLIKQYSTGSSHRGVTRQNSNRSLMDDNSGRGTPTHHLHHPHSVMRRMSNSSVTKHRLQHPPNRGVYRHDSQQSLNASNHSINLQIDGRNMGNLL